MELRQFRYFLKAKDLLNFTEAAKELNISQSTLSQQIKQLEDELDVPLFNRIGKRISLTEAGNKFGEYALQSINKANEGLLFLQDLKKLNTGKITIGVVYSMRLLFAKTLIRFANQYPNIKIKVVFGTTKDLLERMYLHHFDFILNFHDGPKDKLLKYQTLLKSNMVLVTAKTSPLALKKMITLKEMAGLPLALPFSGNSTIKFIEESFSKKNLIPNICIEINDIPTIFEIVKTGRWHTMISDTDVNDPDLVAIAIDAQNMRRTIMIISLREVYEKKAVKKFWEMLTKF